MAVEDLGDHLFRAVSGRSPNSEEGRALARDEYSVSMLATLRDAFGGVTPLARFLGVARTTVQRWFGGAGKGGRPAMPNEASQDLIMMAVRSIRMRRSRKYFRSRNQIVVKGYDRYDPSRFREIKLDRRHLAPGWQDALVNGYITDGAAGIRGAFLGNFANNPDGRWYRDYFSSNARDHGIDVTGVEW